MIEKSKVGEEIGERIGEQFGETLIQYFSFCPSLYKNSADKSVYISFKPFKLCPINFSRATSDTPHSWHRVLNVTLKSYNFLSVPKISFIFSLILYGIDSDPYRVRVLGQFPKSQPDTFIALALVEKAYENYRTRKPNENDKVIALHLGVDVARFGDDESTIYLAVEYKSGLYIVKNEEIIYKNTTVELTGKTKATIRRLNSEFPDLTVNVNVDGTGVGAGVVDELDSNHGDLKYYVSEQTFGGQGGTLENEPIRYSNNTGLIWGNIKRLLMSEKLWIEEDSKLTEELTNRKYSVNEDGFIQLERKKDMKKRDVSSPDRADGVGLSLATNLQHSIIQALLTVVES